MDQDLMQYVNPVLVERVLAGELEISDPKTWYSPDKAVIRDATTKGLVKGSGKVKGSKSPVEASRESAFKRRRSYHELAERYVNPDDERNPEAIISFKELMDTLINAANGSPQEVECPHPECAEKHHVVAFKKDGATLFKIYENLKGKAKETQEVNMNSKHLVAILNERTPVTEVSVRVLSDEEIQTRRKTIMEAD